MSIATEITRLQTAKVDIKSAIESKGVTVPSNATLDDYDTYISQIQTGPEYIIYTDEKHYILGTDTSNKANYFDLGFHWKNTLRIEGKIWYNFGEAWRRFIAIGDKNSDSWNSSLQIVSGSTTGCSVILNGSNIGINNCFKNTAWNRFSIGQRGDSKFSFWTQNQDHDWNQYYNGNMQSQIANTNLMLFQGYENSSDTVWQLSHLQVFDAPNTSTWPTTLIHEYWPAIRTSDKQVGLWDGVTNTFIAPTINGNGHIFIWEHLS